MHDVTNTLTIVMFYMPPGFGKTTTIEKIKERLKAEKEECLVTRIYFDDFSYIMGGYKHYTKEKGAHIASMQKEAFIEAFSTPAREINRVVFIDKTNVYPKERALFYAPLGFMLTLRRLFEEGATDTGVDHDTINKYAENNDYISIFQELYSANGYAGISRLLVATKETLNEKDMGPIKQELEGIISSFLKSFRYRREENPNLGFIDYLRDHYLKLNPRLLVARYEIEEKYLDKLKELLLKRRMAGGDRGLDKEKWRDIINKRTDDLYKYKPLSTPIEQYVLQLLEDNATQGKNYKDIVLNLNKAVFNDKKDREGLLNYHLDLVVKIIADNTNKKWYSLSNH